MLDPVERQLRLPSPIQEIFPNWIKNSTCRLFVKRDDLIHPHICGNKWRKLKYNLLEAKLKDAHVLLTYGGAFSNHLVAVAAAGYFLKISTIGIIRSYEHSIQNPTVEILKSYGMSLSFAHPRDFNSKGWRSNYLKQIEGSFEISEGGTNTLAIQGVQELVEEQDLSHYSHILLAVGTGGTLAGLLNSDLKSKVIAVSPFKNHINDFKGLRYLKSKSLNFEIVNSALNSKFGSYHEEMLTFANQFLEETDISLDPIYTAKAMMTLKSIIDRCEIEEGSNVLFLHTGGLQGIQGFNERYNCNFHVKK